MDGPVMSGAEQHAVGEVSGAAGRPWPHVVGFGPARWSVAARERTAAVSVGQRDALRGCEEPLLAAHVEHLAVAAEDDWQDAGVAGELADGVGTDAGAVGVGAAPLDVALQGLVVGGDDKGGGDPAVVAEGLGGHVADDRGERAAELVPVRGLVVEKVIGLIRAVVTRRRVRLECRTKDVGL